MQSGLQYMHSVIPLGKRDLIDIVVISWKAPTVFGNADVSGTNNGLITILKDIKNKYTNAVVSM